MSLPITKNYGNQESGRINQILTNAKQCAVKNAIQKARASCGPPKLQGPTNVQPESSYLASKMNTITTSVIANRIATQGLHGVPQSMYIKRLEQEVHDNAKRFDEYKGPQVKVQCPPIPLIYTNAFLPKPSVKCTILNILNSGSAL